MRTENRDIVRIYELIKELGINGKLNAEQQIELDNRIRELHYKG